MMPDADLLMNLSLFYLSIASAGIEVDDMDSNSTLELQRYADVMKHNLQILDGSLYIQRGGGGGGGPSAVTIYDADWGETPPDTHAEIMSNLRQANRNLKAATIFLTLAVIVYVVVLVIKLKKLRSNKQ